jgi:hypothetical protein
MTNPSKAEDTYVMVPREPTREMWAASGDALVKLVGAGILHHDKLSEAAWTAMLAASPPIPEPGLTPGLTGDDLCEALLALMDDNGYVTPSLDTVASRLNAMLADRLSPVASEAFARALIDPPEPNDALREAAARYASTIPEPGPERAAGGSNQDRLLRTGAMVHDKARRLGWLDDGEGAYEFLSRKTYDLGREDALSQPHETTIPGGEKKSVGIPEVNEPSAATSAKASDPMQVTS